ncbi:hypothetical protein D3C80_1732120 [compost metagenome]
MCGRSGSFSNPWHSCTSLLVRLNFSAWADCSSRRMVRVRCSSRLAGIGSISPAWAANWREAISDSRVPMMARWMRWMISSWRSGMPVSRATGDRCARAATRRWSSSSNWLAKCSALKSLLDVNCPYMRAQARRLSDSR